MIFCCLLISIIFPPKNFNSLNKKTDSTNSFENVNYKILTSSSSAPNIDYFDYYKTITINHAKVNGSGSHTNFPLLISILDSDLHNHVNQSNGNDIAFANDTDWLDHEIEIFNQNYNDTHAQLVAWVRIPSLSTSTNTTLYMYYGNATMTSRENPINIWSNYTSIWHLKESSGTGYYIKDSTINNYDGQPSGTGYLPNGMIGSARNFLAGSDGITINGGSDLLNGNNTFAFSFWIYPNYASDLEWQNAGTKLVFYKSSSINLARFWRDPGYPAGRGLFQADIHFVTHTTLYNNFYIYRQSWNKILYYYDGNYFGIHLNGEEIYQLEIGSDSLISDSSTFVIGATGSDCFNGYIDEFRISSNVNTKGWYETEFNNQNDTKSFFTLSSELRVDVNPPTYSNLIESADQLELGETEVIEIDVIDLSGISQVKIEFEGSNHSMTNIGGDTWQYNNWTPSNVGTYIYTIYMQDNATNWNSTSDAIEVIDTTLPSYSGLIEDSDPLELGEQAVIEINASDLSGISQVKIEFEGSNHSMTNIGGDTWQYNNWTPSNMNTYDYIIYIEDYNGNWNWTSSNITVEDSITPSPPQFTNSPSGVVNGILTFDWYDGSDPSGISYYILIIDNETNPSITPGYVFFVNITNVGNASSYYELTQVFPSGRYYYFLAQVDGAGHQSDFTMGSFTINVNNNLMIYIIIAIALTSVSGSVTAIVIVRKKSQKKLRAPRKKIPLKLILSHIEEISSSLRTSDGEDNQDLIIQKLNAEDINREELLDERQQQPNIEEIKNLGEELFDEGAYLEAIKQFEQAKEILRNQGKEEEATLFLELIDGIRSLIKEREMRIDTLEVEKINGNSLKIFELYQDVIEISKKLRDFDAVDMFKSEMMDFFDANKLKVIELQKHRINLEEQAELSSNIGQFEKATQQFGMCERISELLMNYNKNEIINVEKFKNKKLDLLEKLNND